MTDPVVGPVNVTGKTGKHRYGSSHAVRVSKEDAQAVALFPVMQIPSGCEADVRRGTFIKPDTEGRAVVSLVLENTGKHWFLCSTVHRKHWAEVFKVAVV